MTAPATDRMPIMDIARSDSERLRVTVSQYRGRTFIDLRVWYSAEGGEYKPSGKGVTIRPNQVPEILQGLRLAAEAIDPQGGC